jgi:23S rRNA (uridine2552-2'-O)-methyltransferase
VTGVAIDRPGPQYLAELALDFAIRVLKPNGAVLIKTFQGAGFQELVETTRRSFSKVRFAKPDTSRARSSELYLLASGFRMV